MTKVQSLTLGLSFSLFVCATFTNAQVLTKEAKIERILAITKANSLVDQLPNHFRLLTEFSIPPETPPEERKKIEVMQSQIQSLFKAINAKLSPLQVKIYNDLFTDDEIDGLLAFYESPTGRVMIEKMPLIMSQMMIATQTVMKDIEPELQRIIKEGSQR